jgi:hypothetical protein
MILKALAKIIALPHLYAYVRSPVNLMFTELNKALASGFLKIDQPFRALYACAGPLFLMSCIAVLTLSFLCVRTQAFQRAAAGGGSCRVLSSHRVAARNAIHAHSEVRALRSRRIACTRVCGVRPRHARLLTLCASTIRKMDFRRGLDKFLCRVHSQLCDALSRHDLADLELYLVMLGDYLFFCPTRVMASQVIDVTMETLLHIKVRSRIASRACV